jgi:hypothetical protein
MKEYMGVLIGHQHRGWSPYRGPSGPYLWSRAETVPREVAPVSPLHLGGHGKTYLAAR